jgi:hypothetical protein
MLIMQENKCLKEGTKYLHKFDFTILAINKQNFTYFNVIIHPKFCLRMKYLY